MSSLCESDCSETWLGGEGAPARQDAPAETVRRDGSVSLERQKALRATLVGFRAAPLGRSLGQFGVTLAAYLALNALMYVAIGWSFWLTLALAFPTAGLVVRLFIVQHDCGHGSYFRSKRANHVVGRLCSILTFTPFAFWRRQHNDHHGAFNNLDRRGSGLDLYSTCLTVGEYDVLRPTQRFLYRLSRQPFVSQILLPPFLFLCLYRVPFGPPSAWGRDGAEVLGTNLAIAGALIPLMMIFGVGSVLAVQLPIIVIASIVGAWLFCVQHRFEESQWKREDAWSWFDSTMGGSSFLKLPRWLQWFSGNIGFHHVHHLDARIPNYQLQACHEALPELSRATTLTMSHALRAPTFALWDDDKGRMVRIPRGSALR